LGRLGIDLAVAIPAFAVLLDLPLQDRYPALELAPAQLREVILARVDAAAAAMAAHGPVTLVLEDLHWADPSTLELLDRLTTTGLPAGLLVLATSRPGLDWAPGPDRALAVHLDPLPDPDARQLAVAAARGHVSEQEAREIAARGDRVPLFVEQLAHAFGARERAGQGDGGEPVPGTLAELLQARLDAVGRAKLVAQVAATIGREFDMSLLEEVMTRLAGEGVLDATTGTVEHDLDQLIDARLVEPLEGEGLLRFRHGLVRDSAYQSQLIGDRGTRHRIIAQTLAETRPGDHALTAFHFDRAGLPLEAVTHYLAAVRRAQAAGSFPEVLAHLTRSEALLPAVADETVRARLELAVRMNRGLAVSSTAGYAAPQAVEDFGRARDLSDQLGHVPEVGTELLGALFGLWSYYAVSGDLDTAASLSTAIARQLEGGATMHAAHPSLAACQGVELYYRGDLLGARELFEQAVAGVADDDVDPAEWPLPNDPLAAACAFLGPVRFLTGDQAGAREAIRTGMTRAQPLEFPRGPFSVAFVRNYEAVLDRAMGDTAGAIAAAQEEIALGEQHGFFDWIFVGRMQLAAADARAGASLEALDRLGEAIGTWTAVGGQALIPWLLVEQADGHLAGGAPDKASASLDRAFALMERGERVALPEALRLRAELVLRADPAAVPEAAAAFRAAVEVARNQGSAYSLLRAALAWHRRLGAEASEPAGSALAEAVAAYGDDARFPDLDDARALLATEARRVTSG
jgi:tetratricopeptide (TPR) repeat protein